MFTWRCRLQVLSFSRGSLHSHPNKMVSSVATLYCLLHCKMVAAMFTICLQLRHHIILKVCESLIISEGTIAVMQMFTKIKTEFILPIIFLYVIQAYIYLVTSKLLLLLRLLLELVLTPLLQISQFQ